MTRSPHRAATEGLWRHVMYEELVVPSSRLSLGEGDTPVVELKTSHAAGCSVQLKREDLNPTGSHKDRALAFQVSRAKQAGVRRLVISSSGNAAIAAAAYCARAGVDLIAFVSPHTDEGKLAHLQGYHPRIVVSSRALTLARRASERMGVPNLRPSTSEDSVTGFMSLGLEIAESPVLPDAVFTFATSGSSAVGIALGLAAAVPADRMPQLHVVHVGSMGGVGGTAGLSRLCGANTGGPSRRSREVRDLVNRSGGAFWTVTDDEVMSADEMLGRQGVLAAYEGCAGVAVALREAHRLGISNALCIITGRRYLESSSGTQENGQMRAIETDAELDELIEGPWAP